MNAEIFSSSSATARAALGHQLRGEGGQALLALRVVDGAGLLGDAEADERQAAGRDDRGATGALDVASRAFYTLPGLVAIDPSASATANNGRFFFFDVPVMSQQLVVGIGPRLAEARNVRTEVDSVTVITIAP